MPTRPSPPSRPSSPASSPPSFPLSVLLRVPPPPSFRHSSPLLGRGSTCPELAEWIRRPRRNAVRGPPVQAAPVPSIPAESLPQPAPDSIRGTRSGAGTQQQPLRPAPRCHPDLPTSQPLDPSQQPAPSPHAIPRPRPPLHPHHPSAQPSSPPKNPPNLAPADREPPKGFPVGGCEYPHKRAVTPPHSPQTHATNPQHRRPRPAQFKPATRKEHPTTRRASRVFWAKPSTRSCSFSWGTLPAPHETHQKSTPPHPHPFPP